MKRSPLKRSTKRIATRRERYSGNSWRDVREEIAATRPHRCESCGKALRDFALAHRHGLGSGGGVRHNPDARCPNCGTWLNRAENLAMVCRFGSCNDAVAEAWRAAVGCRRSA